VTIRNWFGRVTAALAGLAMTGCAPAQAPQAGAANTARPALWKLSDEDTTVYLFGTFHMLPEGLQWRTAAVDAAIAASDELVLEVANVDDPMAAAQGLMSLGISPGLPPLAQRVPAEKREALAAMVAESGYPAAVLDRLETWAAALTLLGVSFKRLGLDPELGVERLVTKPFKAAGKKVSGLETVAEQFGFFDTLPEESQRAFLSAMLDSQEEAEKQFRAMLKAWAAGDVEAVARTFDSEVSLSPELRRRRRPSRGPGFGARPAQGLWAEGREGAVTPIFRDQARRLPILPEIGRARAVFAPICRPSRAIPRVRIPSVAASGRSRRQ
jgi:uncharacterized protein YbaP (TraB family)